MEWWKKIIHEDQDQSTDYALNLVLKHIFIMYNNNELMNKLYKPLLTPLLYSSSLKISSVYYNLDNLQM